MINYNRFVVVPICYLIMVKHRLEDMICNLSFLNYVNYFGIWLVILSAYVSL